MAVLPRFALRKFTSQFIDPALARPARAVNTDLICPGGATTLQANNYYMKPQQKKKTAGWKWIAGVTGVGLLGGGLMLGGNWTGLDDEFGIEPFPKQQYHRARNKMSDWSDYMFEPRSQEQLLPDVLPPPWQAPYTLLIELNDLLIHQSYSRKNGWRRKKRQGVDVLLENLCRHYEIVIFTNETAMNCFEVIEAIDKKQCSLYKLFRDSTRYKKGVYLKDLSNLNRDLSKVILVDTDRAAVACQPENAIIVPKWMGEDELDLVDLADMLLVIAQDRPKDVRDVIKCYTDLEDPVQAYRMRRTEILEQETRLKFEKMEKSKQTGGLIKKKWW